jgi:Uma2 family endonuclease
MNVLRKPDPARMSRGEFRAWADAQPSWKYERIGGLVFAMAPESVLHADRKGGVYRSLHNAVRAAGLPCRAYVDGPTVEVEDNDFVPDVILRCGPPVTSGMTIPDPMVVVEVLSPSTQVVDLTTKREAYFQIPSVMHYLVVSPDTQRVQRFSRRAEGIVETLITSGHIDLDPPEIAITVDDIYS